MLICKKFFENKREEVGYEEDLSAQYNKDEEETWV